jgi:hypothetical protein
VEVVSVSLVKEVERRPGSETLAAATQTEEGKTGEPAPNGLTLLSALTAVLGGATALAGLLWWGGAGPFLHESVRGQEVEIYGRGLYELDTVFTGAANKGTDFVTLTLAIPLLLLSLFLFRRGSSRGRFLLLGTLVWFVYVGATYSLGPVAYNRMFLVYGGLFSASLFAFILAFRNLERAGSTWFSAELPRKRLGVFMVASGVIVSGIWLMDPLETLLTGATPRHLGHYSTLFTHALDLAIIVPAALVAGILILRRRPVGYLVAASLLVLEAMMAPMMAAQTVSQLRAGVSFTTAEVAGVLGGFGVLAVVAIGMLVDLLRHVPSSTEARRLM